MRDGTTRHRFRTWISALMERAERYAFGELDLDAVARGWEVRRDSRFRRTYRDPRWDNVLECPSCHGSGVEGADTCAECEGRGTVRPEPAPLAGAP